MKKILLFLSLPLALFSNPVNGKIVFGEAEIAQSEQEMIVSQKGGRAIIEWEQFSIASDEVAKFIQPSKEASILNRVTGDNLSEIYGRLESNGRIFLINPNGIMIGPKGVIDTGFFLASALKLSNEEFLQNDLHFSSSDGIIKNEGTIKASEGVYLFAREVDNRGKITAPKAGLGAATELYFKEGGTEHIYILKETSGHLNQKGLIESAEIELKSAGGNIFNIALNQEGILNAVSFEERNGNILLFAEKGLLKVSNQLIAHGGSIEILGSDIEVDNALIDVSSSAKAGEVKIGSAKTEKLLFGASAKVNASAIGEGMGGRVVLLSQDTRFLGSVEAEGGKTSGDGGFVEISSLSKDPANPHLIFKGRVSTLAPRGQIGELLLDPYDITISSAPSQNGEWTDGEFSGTAPGVILQNSDLVAQLVSTNVTVTTAGSGTDGGTITVSDTISWESPTKLTLLAGKSIVIEAPISNTYDTDENFDAMDFRANSSGLTAGNFKGIRLKSSLSSLYGNISLQAQGGNSGNENTGIDMVSGSIFSLADSANAARITLNGTGGAGDKYNRGAALQFSSKIESLKGDISITGSSSGSKEYNCGIYLQNSSISSKGTGLGAARIMLHGTAEAGSSNNCGVHLEHSSQIDSLEGNISLEGSSESREYYNAGVSIAFDSFILSRGIGERAALITVIGSADTGGSYNTGINISYYSYISSKNGNISCTGNSLGSQNYNNGIHLSDGSYISSSEPGVGAATITLIGTSAGRNYNHGIVIERHTSVTSIDGAISLTGTSEAQGNNNYGFYMNSDAFVSSLGTDFSAAPISIFGYGGNEGNFCPGILLVKSVYLASVAGDISLAGTSRGQGENNCGIILQLDSFINSGGTSDSAKIYLAGTAGDGLKNSCGIYLSLSSYLTSINGDIGLVGEGFSKSSSNVGVSIDSDSYIYSRGETEAAAKITIDGTGGDGDSYEQGVYIADITKIVSSAGAISITGNGKSE